MKIARTREDLAWAAGLFEGEGSFGLKLGKYPSAQLVNTDMEILLRFQKVMGCGKIYAEKPKPNSKQVYRWCVQTYELTQAVVCLLWHQLSTRRQLRAIEVLEQGRINWLAAPRSGDNLRYNPEPPDWAKNARRASEDCTDSVPR